MKESILKKRFIPLQEQFRKWQREKLLFERYRFLNRFINEFGEADGKNRFIKYYPDSDPEELLSLFE